MCLLGGLSAANAEVVKSPDGKLSVDVNVKDGEARYSVVYDGTTVLLDSPLGLEANFGDYSKHLKFESAEVDTVRDSYDMNRTKQSHKDVVATRLQYKLTNQDGATIRVEFHVDNHNVGLRYRVSRHGETGSIRVMREATGYHLPAGTTCFLTPQSKSMVGWKRTKPSYEEEYVEDAPLSQKSQFGNGWTMPALFKVAAASPASAASAKGAKAQQPSNLWVLISETDVDSRYCGSRLSDASVKEDGSAIYTVTFPMATENNGNGTVEPAFALPGYTPWRTITVGDLGDVAETTIMQDLVTPRYEASKEYDFGKGTWSWIVWQDNSICYEDQIKYIDLSAGMGYKFALVDNWWDTNMGREQIEKLAAYARERNVRLIMWYSSSGYWNNIEQGPINCMDNSIIRKREMKWLKELGVAGIKVDFFGGDKQETMRLYEQILSDANDNGLFVIFHGCTIPRGWERMYPNYVGSEAVLASENIYFGQHACDVESRDASLHPFIRNAQGCMEFGGCFMNRRIHRKEGKGTYRRTSDAFELATCILFQNPIQNFALTPNNLFGSESKDNLVEEKMAPAACLDFLKEVPTTWDELRVLDGYPGKYVALARRHGDRWYIAAVNACKEPLKLTLDLSQLEGLDVTKLQMISGGLPNEDHSTITPVVKNTPKTKKGKLTLTLQYNDGVVIY